MSRTSRSSAPSVRWWPLALIVVAAIAGILVANADPERQRQDRFVLTASILFLAGGGALIWLVALSRLSARLRWGGFVAALAVAAALAASVEMRGHTGDLVPELGWRWASRDAPTVPDAAGAAPVPESAVETIDPDRDYPQLLGPERDGVVRGVRLATDWEARPPRELWRVPVGEGWSGFAVVGPLAVTLEQRGEEEWVVAYGRSSGRAVWSHAERARWEDPLGGPGPRSTPTIADGTVYAYGGTGLLVALDLADGSLRWRRDVPATTGARPPEYGVAASPLVHEDLVIVPAGGTGHAVVAYDRADGSPRWSTADDPAAYSSPRVAVLAGREQVLQLTAERLLAVAPSDGALLWSAPWPRGTQNTSQPVVLPGDRVYLSSGYGVGGTMYRVDEGPAGLAATVQWRSRSLKAKFTDVVAHDGFLYGLDDGILVCVDATDGARRWKRGRYGHGQVLLVGDVLLVSAETGDLALVAADPGGFRELAARPVLDGRTWNHPALAGPHLFMRNDREAVALELPLVEDVATTSTGWYGDAP